MGNAELRWYVAKWLLVMSCERVSISLTKVGIRPGGVARVEFPQ